MSLFGAIVGVVVETVKLPIAVVADVVCFPRILDGAESFTAKKLEDIKDEAEKAGK